MRARSATGHVSFSRKVTISGQIRCEATVMRAMLDATAFEKVVRDGWGPRRPRHADAILRRLKADVFLVIADRPATDSTSPSG
jgi:hypothetical protein